MIVRLTVLIIAASLVGCASLSSLQTARTTPKGKTSFAVGAGYLVLPQLSEEAENSGIQDTGLPLGEVMVRRGLSESFDLGLKYTFPSQLLLDGKWNFLRSEFFDLATGAGVGYRGATGSAALQEINVLLPIYMNINLGRYFTIYLSPKYFLQTFAGGAESVLFHLLAGTGGLRIGGEVFGLLLEGTYTQIVATSGSGSLFGYYQGNGALYFTF